MNGKTILLPPSYLLIGILMKLVLHYQFLVVEIMFKPFILLGIFPIFLSLSTNLFADQLFKKANTTQKPSAYSAVSFTRGIYSYSRNPMYLGMVLVLIGVAIHLGSLTPFFVIPIFIALITNLFITYEERKVESKLTFKGRVYFGCQALDFVLIKISGRS